MALQFRLLFQDGSVSSQHWWTLRRSVTSFPKTRLIYLRLGGSERLLNTCVYSKHCDFYRRRMRSCFRQWVQQKS